MVSRTSKRISKLTKSRRLSKIKRTNKGTSKLTKIKKTNKRISKLTKRQNISIMGGSNTISAGTIDDRGYTEEISNILVPQD
jgi:hypothetical protein